MYNLLYSKDRIVDRAGEMRKIGVVRGIVSMVDKDTQVASKKGTTRLMEQESLLYRPRRSELPETVWTRNCLVAIETRICC